MRRLVMKREEQECDVCGHKMSYQDSDDEKATNGIFIQHDIRIDVEERTDYGSRDARAYMTQTDFCSWDCFCQAFETYKEQVSLIAKRIKRL